ncbi:MAG: MOSC domain-containing protein [Gemmatimonadaceae bacterium]|nr:MOSC domain-containing protein [Gemmatimonadaceae bacterium]
MTKAIRPPLATHGVVRAVHAGPIRSLRSPREPDGHATTWRSAILKAPITRADVRLLGLAGDEQKETRHHGGPQKAVLVYAAAHYDALWDAVLRPHAATHAAALRAMSPSVDASRYGFGAFGENLTVDGLTDQTVCLGDVWQVGDSEMEITEPRGPCATLARRWLRPALRREVTETAAAGWYNAVRREGAVSPGDDVVLLRRVQEDWTVARVFALLESPRATRGDLMALRDAPGTHAGLRERLTRRAATPSRTTA